MKRRVPRAVLISVVRFRTTVRFIHVSEIDFDKAAGQDRQALDGARARIHRALKLSPVFDKAARASKDAALAAASIEVLPGDAQLYQQGEPYAGVIILGRGRAS